MTRIKPLAKNAAAEGRSGSNFDNLDLLYDLNQPNRSRGGDSKGGLPTNIKLQGSGEEAILLEDDEQNASFDESADRDLDDVLLGQQEVPTKQNFLGSLNEAPAHKASKQSTTSIKPKVADP